jgi:hypothetical protein
MIPGGRIFVEFCWFCPRRKRRGGGTPPYLLIGSFFFPAKRSAFGVRASFPTEFCQTMAEDRGPSTRASLLWWPVFTRAYGSCSLLTTGTASYPPLQFAVIIELLLPSGIVSVSTAPPPPLPPPHSAFDPKENHATKNKILLKEKRKIKQATTLAAYGASGHERDSEQISRDDECGPG